MALGNWSVKAEVGDYGEQNWYEERMTEKEEGSIPSIINHSGFLTLSLSGCGSRNDSHFVSSASLISSSVRWRMKTGLPRHLIITY